jgi:hypothetical protein
VLFEERDLRIMVTGIRRCLNVTSLAAVIGLFVMSGGGAYAAKDPSSAGGTVLSGSGGAGRGAGGLTVVSFPGVLTATPAVVPASPAPTRVYQSSFGSFPNFGDPEALAVDQSTGDIYVVSGSVGTVSRYTSAGAPDDFTAGPDAGTNTLTGFSFVAPSTAEVAIAPAGAAGGTAGDIYVASSTGVDIYAHEGTHLGQITEANGAGFSLACGVATDNTGKLYIGDFGGNIDRYVPTADPVTNADYDAQVTGVSSPCNVIADSTGAAYASTLVTGPLTKYSASDFGTSNTGTVIDANSRAIAVDPSTDDVYVDEGDKISVFDSTGTLLYTFGSAIDFGTDSTGVAVMGSGGPAYVADRSNHRIDVYGPVVIVPDVVTGEASALSDTSATLGGTVRPNGLALTDCHFEYVADAAFLATGFADLSSGGSAPCSPSAGSIPADLEDHTVTATITGLDPSRIYHFRLVAANTNASIKGLDAVVPGAPLVETTGSPTRTATTVRLDSRVDPRETTASYHFEYGDQGPCDSNPCTSTPSQSAGSTNTFELVSQQLAGLKANTTYHYRIAAENGVPGGVVGKDVAVTTRASDAPLTHGHLPGPPGSDRAWEQVSIPDTSGSPVGRSLAISDNGERAIYAIDGGSPGSQYGGGLEGDNDQYAERTPKGWQNNGLFPTRAQAPGNLWGDPLGPSDLSQAYADNRDVTNTGYVGIWRMTPGALAQLVISVPFEQYNPGDANVTSADGSRVLTLLIGNFDPAHPVGPEDENLYDITTGTPHMVGLLPDGSIPSCGVKDMDPTPAQGWVTADGSHAFFSSFLGARCQGPKALFVRDLLSSTTVQIAAHVKFIRGTADAAFFTTEDSLAAGDKGGNDIYRYTIQDGGLDCLTCSTAAAGSVISGDNQTTDFDAIAVSDDGTHIYFRAAHRLLPGAAAEGIYRLHVPDSNVAYVAPVAPGGARVSGYTTFGNAMSPDGSVFVFQSNNPALDAVNGAQSGGTLQDYRYDDNDRSLVCVSCPGDGSLPRGPLNSVGGLEGPPDGAPGAALTSGGDLVFVTPTPLAADDQNTALPNQDPAVGDDVYEWRDGRLLLVTDGQSFNAVAPSFAGVSRSGRDVFFIQAAQLTPDAIDAQRRLYDARIGGGFDFPRAPEPCSLDACQCELLGTGQPRR